MSSPGSIPIDELRDQASESLSEAARMYAHGTINLQALEELAMLFAVAVQQYERARKTTL